jgi:probable phosphoglycerate mutase
MLLLLARHGNTFNKGDKIVWVGARTDLPLTAKGREQALALGQALAPFASRIKRVISGPLLRTREHAGILCEALQTPSPQPSPQGERESGRSCAEGIRSPQGERGQAAAPSQRGDGNSSVLSPQRGEGQGEGGLDPSSHASPFIDERLREIDYGLWEAKSSEEIQAMGGGAELDAWNKAGEWPRSPGWTPAHEAIAANVAELAAECAAGLGEGDAALLVTSNGILKFFLKLVPGAFEDMAARGALKVATGHCCALRHGPRGWEVLFWDREPGQIVLG